MFKSIRAMMILLTLALFLGACLPAASGQPAAQPQQNTQSQAEIQAQINTSVAQTIEAQNQVGTFVAQTMQAQASPTSTATPFAIPTFTPFVVPSATSRPVSGGGGGTGGGTYYGGNGSGGAGSPQYDCAVVAQKPNDGDRIWKPGDEFDVEWTLKNTGTKTIAAGYPFMYIGGDDISPTGTLVSGAAVEPGDLFAFRIEVIAPQVQGLDKQQFTMQWAFIVEGNKICKPYIAIFVQRK
jgi:hypothetical protein